MLEETHYYPFGLTMAGISSKALKPIYAENKRKYNGIEYDNDLDLDTYEAYYRNLDPQTARWWQIDPKVDEGYESVSPYASMYDDPIRYSDPLGDEADEADDCCKVLKKIFANVSGAVVGTIDNNIPGSNLRGAVASSGIIEDPEVADAWNRGLDVADEAGIVQGVGESTGGAGLTTGSVAVTGGTGGLSIEVTGPAAAVGLGLTAHGLFVTGKSVNNLVSQNGRVHIEQTNSSSSSSKKNTSNSSSNSSQSKVEKSKKTESIGGKYTKTTEVRPGKGPGQSRAEYTRYKNKQGTVIRTHKDTYDRANKFQHRKPLRGGPEGRSQNE